MDRTNWKWGRKNINILMLAMVYKGVAIPLLWSVLDKQGNSNTVERIALVDRYLALFGVTTIEGLLCDREFVGKEWFGYLEEKQIGYYIRVKQGYLSTTSRGLETTIEALFYHLQVNQHETLKGQRIVLGHEVYLTGLRLESGELLVVAGSRAETDHLEIYGLRWEIESLFHCLKGRGFNFEATHLTELTRIDRLTAVLAITFAWAHKVGDWHHEHVKKIKRKKHGRLAMSYFRYGLDWIRQALCGDQIQRKLINTCLQQLSCKTISNCSPSGNT